MGTVMTLASIPAILALVQLAKSLGVTGKWNTLLAVVLGVVLKLGDAAFISGASTPAEWYTAFGAGLLLGLGAAGLYDAASIASSAGTVTAYTLDTHTTTTGAVPDAAGAEDTSAHEVATGGATPRGPSEG